MLRWCLVWLSALGTVCSAAAQSPNPIVIIETNHGVIKLELLADKAPLTVNNFLQYVHDGFYDGTLFHRVYKDFYLQGGGLEPGLKVKPTRAAIKSEAGNGLRNQRGFVGLTRTATAQFYINVADNAYIDGLQPPYTVFAKVVDGMEVVDKIKMVPVANKDKFDAVPVEDVVIRSIRLASQFQLARVKNAVYVVGSAFTISAHVEYPSRGQTLTLELPPGLERIDGKERQPVPIVADADASFITWRVRGLRPGEYDVTVRAHGGKAQTMKVKVVGPPG